MDAEQLLRAFLSSDNATRRAAEASLYALRAANKDELPLLLVKVLRIAAAVELRCLAAVLLRRVSTAAAIVAPSPTRGTSDGSAGTAGTAVADDDRVHWELMSDAARTAVQADLLAAIQAEPHAYVRRLIIDTTAEISMIVFDSLEQQWPELWQLVYTWAQSPDAGQRHAALLMLGYLAGPVVDRFSAQLPSLATLFVNCMMDETAPTAVRVCAANAGIAVATEIPTRDPRADVFESLVAPMLNLTRRCAAAGDDESSRELSSIFCDLTDVHTNLLKRHLPDILALGRDIGCDERMDNRTRRHMLEALVLVAERTPGVARKMPHRAFVTTVLSIIMKMLTEHGDDAPALEVWDASHPNVNVVMDDGDNIDTAVDALNRITEPLTGPHVLPALTPMIEQHLAQAGADKWLLRFAGLAALAHVSDVVPDTSSAHKGLAAQVVPFVSDVHPRVRHAALAVIANLCDFQGPQFQRRTHAIIAPALLAALRDVSQRVRAQACLATANFTDHLVADVDTDVVAPYVRDLLIALFAIVTGSVTWAQEHALTAVSGLIDASGSALAPFYAELQPSVQGILAASEPPPELLAVANSTGRDHRSRQARNDAQAKVRHLRLMKGRAIECLTLLGQTVPPDVFRPQAIAIMGTVVDLLRTLLAQRHAAADASSLAAQASALHGPGSPQAVAASAAAAAASTDEDDEDPVMMFMWEAIGRLARVMRDEFAPFLSIVIPPLLQEAARQPSLIAVTRTAASDVAAELGMPGTTDGDDDDDDADGTPTAGSEYMEVKVQGSVRARARISELQDKMSAVRGLGSIFTHVPSQQLAPYAPSAVQCLCPLLNRSSAPMEDIRTHAAGSLSDVMAACCSVLHVADARAAYAATAGSQPPAALSGLVVTTAAVDRLALGRAAMEAIHDAIVEEESSGAHDIETMNSYVVAAMHLLTEACRCTKFADGKGMDESQYVPLLDVPLMQKLTQVLLTVRTGALNRRAVRASELTVYRDEYDDDAVAAVKESDEDDFEMMFNLVELLGTLIKSHRELYLPMYNSMLAALVVDMSHPVCVPADKRLAAFLMVDVLEHLEDAAIDATGQHYAHSYLPILCRGVSDADAAVRQACLYGVGAAAAACPTAFAPHAGSCIQTLIHCIQHPHDGTPTTAEDNAVTALAKVVTHAMHGGTAAAPGIPARSELVSLIVSCLPLVHDLDEGELALNIVCSWFESGDAELTTQLTQPATLLHLLPAFAKAMDELGYCNETLCRRIGRILLRVSSAVGQALVAQLWAQFSAPHRKCLEETAASAAAYDASAR